MWHWVERAPGGAFGDLSVRLRVGLVEDLGFSGLGKFRFLALGVGV